MKPPIFVFTDDFLVFDTLQHAESYLEPYDVKEDDELYDSEGRKLKEKIVSEKVCIARYFVLPIKAPRVRIFAVEDEPKHEERLRNLIIDFLSRVGDKSDLKDCTTEELVQKSLKFKN
ncbi:MAG TPA: hypothetical protein VGH16_23440 [Candidatus Binatia bacterium]|jgi:hypothetical protein